MAKDLMLKIREIDVKNKVILLELPVTIGKTPKDNEDDIPASFVL